MSYAVVFPGQGSQKLGMLSDYADHPVVKNIYERASAVLGYDLWGITQHQEEKLNQTEYTQPAILTASYVYWSLNQEALSSAVYLAGHSLGEYTALLCAGALKFEDAVKLVSLRGKFMQEAVPEGIGAMAAILGLDDDKVIQACEMARESEIVDAVNFNSPGQVVIAGHEAAVYRAMAFATQLGAKRALPLPVSVPSHCALMKPAAVKLEAVLNNIQIDMPKIPVIHNVDVSTHMHSAEIIQALVSQLDHPVRWVETIQKVAAYPVQKIIEMGPGKVLTGLNKRIIASESGIECVNL